MDEILLKISNLENIKVISFDIESHEKLSELKITHEKVESFIEIDDQNLIDELVYDMSVNWYNQGEVPSILKFDNLNLGCLIEGEIIPFFLQTMKNFMGIIKIIETECPSNIIASNFLCSLTKSIDNKNKIITNSLSEKKNSTNLDRIVFSFSIGRYPFSIWIPLKFALKMANFVENIIGKIFNFRVNSKMKFDKGTILLLNLNPNPYELLLIQLSLLDKNIVLLYEPGTAVWNLKNLKIVKSSGLKIIKLEDFLNKKENLIILQKQEKLKANFSKLYSNDDLNTFFSIRGFSFWSTIKDDFLTLCLKKFNDAIKRNELSKILFKKTNVRCVVSTYNPNPEEKIILNVSKDLKIPSFVLQHAYYITGKYIENFLPIVFPPLQKGIIHLLWGNLMKKYLCKFNVVDKKDMLVSGNPRYDKYFKIKHECKNTGTILITSSFLQNYFKVSSYDTNLAMLHKKIFREICEITNKIPQKKPIIKLHPAVKPAYNVQSIVDEIDSNIPIYKTRSIIDLMKNCDVVVAMDHSTILLEAMILEKPTIIFAVNSKWYDDDAIIKNGATIVVNNVDEFKITLDKILYDKKFRNELIQKGNQFVNKCLANPGTASEYLARLIDKY